MVIQVTTRLCRWARFTIFSIVLTAAPAPMADQLRPRDSSTLQTLVDELQKGGYVIYLRHAMTNHDKVHQAQPKLDDCTTQRNLSQDGRLQARSIGATMSALRIPIGRVLSSPYCRCVDTATLAFGRVEVDADLAFSITENEENTQRLGRHLAQLLATSPAANSNTVIVSHTTNLKTAAEIWPRPEGVAVVFQPLDDQNFVHVGTIVPEAWQRLLSNQAVRY